MRTETIAGPPAAYVLQQPPSLPETTEPDLSRCDLRASRSDLPAEHDATLLVAALEDLEAQRAAIEWLLDADLLWVCMA